MRFIHAVESLKDVRQRFFRNPDAGIRDLDRTELVIPVDLGFDPAAFVVVFNAVFDQIRHGQRELGLVDLCADRMNDLQNQLHLCLLRDRRQAFEDLLHKGSDVDGSHFQLVRGALIHLDQREQIVDDAGFAVDLLYDILHEFPVEFGRYILSLLDERIGQHFDARDRRFQLMGDVCDKFLPGCVQGLHTADHLRHGQG